MTFKNQLDLCRAVLFKECRTQVEHFIKKKFLRIYVAVEFCLHCAHSTSFDLFLTLLVDTSFRSSLVLSELFQPIF